MATVFPVQQALFAHPWPQGVGLFVDPSALQTFRVSPAQLSRARWEVPMGTPFRT